MRVTSLHLHAEFADWEKLIRLPKKLRREQRRIDREIERITLGHEPEPEESHEDDRD